MRRLYAIAIAFLFAGVMIWLLVPASPPEPIYQGKPLRYWLRGYRAGNHSWNESTPEKADEAVTKLGTNAIPVLLKMIQSHDSAWDIKLIKSGWSYKWRRWAQKLPYIKIQSGPHLPSYDVVEAMSAFRNLGPRAAGAAAPLAQLLDRDDPSMFQGSITLVLAGIGRPASPAVPALLRKLQNSNPNVRGNALHALGRIHAEPGLVVPAATKALDDPDPYVRARAAHALQDFGADAKSSVPVLLNKLRTWKPLPPSTSRFPPPSEDPIDPARTALKTIDPEAAAKLDWK